MTKASSEHLPTRNPRRTARMSVLPCCLIDITSSHESSPIRNPSPPNDYILAPPSTPLKSPPKTPLVPQVTSPMPPLTTLKVTPPPLTTPSFKPSQPSKQTPPLTTTIEACKLIFTTPPTSPHPYFDKFEDLPPGSTNPNPLPSFESIKRLVIQPPPLPDIMVVEPTLPPIPPYFPPPNTLLPLDQSIWINGLPPPPIRHEHLCEHCQRTQAIAYEV
ncbi:hypothetical protein Tco_0420888 [Tanacetum coccineum]